MKNLLVYLNPEHCFDPDSGRYAQIQIENSLRFWKPEDILFVTNFPYEHKGIKSLVVPDSFIMDFDKKACKVNVIVHLLEKGIIREDTWFHDFEAFQNAPFDITLTKDLGLTDYGWKPKWNTGSFFFKPTSLDIFTWLKTAVYARRANEEPIFWIMYKDNFNGLQARCQALNITYNVGKRYGQYEFPRIDMPVRVIHFHPYQRRDRLERLTPLISPELLNLINEKSPHIR